MDDLLLEGGVDRIMQEDATSTILLEFNATPSTMVKDVISLGLIPFAR